MNKRVLAAVAAGALCAGIGGTAFADHLTATEVDSVDGNGIGVHSGHLSPDDSADWYAVRLRSGDRITIDLSDSVDAYVSLYLTGDRAQAGDLRAGYTLVAADDDSGPDFDAHLSTTVADTGWYVIAAERFGGGDTDYTLTVDASSGPAECPTGWNTQPATGPDDPFDENGDGTICTQDIDGKGQGSSANTNRDGDQDPNGHLDGHNHMDNRV